MTARGHGVVEVAKRLGMSDKSLYLWVRQAKDDPEHLRRVRFKDPTGKTLIFLTNNTALPAPVIAQLYKNRWQVELFSKWIKQHLRIKKFLDPSENAEMNVIGIFLLTGIRKLSFFHSLQGRWPRNNGPIKYPDQPRHAMNPP